MTERSAAALIVAGSIPARNKYLYGLQIVVSDLVVSVCDFSMFVNALRIQEVLLVWSKVFFFNLTMCIYTPSSAHNYLLY